MQITLTYAGQRANYEIPDQLFDPRHKSAWNRRKTYCWHRIDKQTNLSPPFDRLFVKWWIDRKAPAHQILLKACGAPFPGTSGIFGMAPVGRGWIYVFEFLPYRLLEELFEEPSGEKWLTSRLLLRVIEQSQACFEALGAQEHVYTDFCASNIMVDTTTSDVKLIDLDSAWSFEELKQKGCKPDISVSSQAWYLWVNCLLKRYDPVIPRLTYLPITMVLSFAALWGRALGLLNNQPRSVGMAIETFKENWDGNLPKLWTALEIGNQQGIRQFFNLGSRANLDDVSYVWREVVADLLSGKAPYADWKDVRKAVSIIADQYTSAQGREEKIWQAIGKLLTDLFASISKSAAGVVGVCGIAWRQVVQFRLTLGLNVAAQQGTRMGQRILAQTGRSLWAVAKFVESGLDPLDVSGYLTRRRR